MNRIPSLEEAVRILGRANVIDQNSAAKCFKIGLLRRLFLGSFFLRIPFSRARLEECKGTHKLIFVFPISIRKMSKAFFHWVTKLDENSKRLDEKVLDGVKGMKMGWHLIRIDPVAYLDMHTYSFETPLNGLTVYYAMLACFAHSNKILLENECVDCPNFMDGSRRLSIGSFKPFESKGIYMNLCEDEFFNNQFLMSSVPEFDMV